MRRIWILAVCLLVLCGCERTMEKNLTEPVFTTAEEVWAVEAQETYPEAPGEVAVVYENLEALTEAAAEVVKVSVQSVREERKFLTADVVTEVMVLETWKGDLQENAVISVREPGGARDTVQGNVPRMEQDRTYVLFLQEDGEEFRICGAIQGRFIDRSGYLFQQTWTGLKIPETPARTGNMESMVSILEPQPTHDTYGPPWIWEFENSDAAKNFIKAAKTLETCARWIEDNPAVHAGLLSDPERAARIAEDLKNVPIPTMAAELPMEVYPDFDRRFVAIMYREEEKLFRATISMDTKSVEAEKYGRLIETNNFHVLYDQNDVLAEMSTTWVYVGQVNGYRISIFLEGYGEEEALLFVKSLEFETLSEENKVN